MTDVPNSATEATAKEIMLRLRRTFNEPSAMLYDQMEKQIAVAITTAACEAESRRAAQDAAMADEQAANFRRLHGEYIVSDDANEKHYAEHELEQANFTLTQFAEMIRRAAPDPNFTANLLSAERARLREVVEKLPRWEDIEECSEPMRRHKDGEWLNRDDVLEILSED